MVTICCSVTKALRDYLDDLAEECEDTRSEIMREILKEFSEHNEWEDEVFPSEETEEIEESEEPEELEDLNA